MIAAALLLNALIDVQAATAPIAPRQSAEPPAGALHVGLAAPVYQPDGGVSVETATLGNEATNLLYVYGRRTMCDTATTATKEPAEAGFGWRLMSHTISESPTELVVSV